jgi:uncharacterized protein YgiB involved in biofilm formation
MKKSRSIRLVLLGGASLALAACGDDDGLPTDAKFFSSLSECTAFYDEAQCQNAKVAADQAYAAEAPRFATKQDCESEFGVGSCENRQVAAATDGGQPPAADGSQPAEAGSSGGSFFMPMLMGYMLGNMMGGNQFHQPVYRGRDGSAVMPNAGRHFNVGSFAGAGAGAAAANSFRPAQQVTQVTRGGFGSTASAYRSTSSGS